MKKIFLIISLFTFWTILAIPVAAQTVDLNENIDLGSGLGGLDTITIPYFPQLSIDSRYQTTFSWISYILVWILVGIIVFWIYKILRAGIKAMGAGDNQEQLQAAFNEVKSVLKALAISFIFPIFLSVLGVLLGYGFVWDWPLAFRSCEGSGEFEYYYQAFAQLETKEEADAVCGIN